MEFCRLFLAEQVYLLQEFWVKVECVSRYEYPLYSELGQLLNHEEIIQDGHGTEIEPQLLKAWTQVWEEAIGYEHIKEVLLDTWVILFQMVELLQLWEMLDV